MVSGQLGQTFWASGPVLCREQSSRPTSHLRGPALASRCSACRTLSERGVGGTPGRGLPVPEMGPALPAPRVFSNTPVLPCTRVPAGVGRPRRAARGTVCFRPAGDRCSAQTFTTAACRLPKERKLRPRTPQTQAGHGTCTSVTVVGATDKDEAIGGGRHPALSAGARGDTQGGSPLTGPGGASSPQRRLPLTVPGRAVFLGPVTGSEVKRLLTYVQFGARHFHVLVSPRPPGGRAVCLPPVGDSVLGGQPCPERERM